MSKPKRYGEHSDSVRAMMLAIDTAIKEKYGKIKPEWNLTLYLLADNIEMYLKCKKSVLANGIFDEDKGAKNPLLATMKDYQATITKQIQHLGISPYAEAKIEVKEVDDTSELLKALTGDE